MSRLVSCLSIRDFRKQDLPDVIEVAGLSFAEEFEVRGFDRNHIEEIVDQVFGIPGSIFLAVSRGIGFEPFKLLVAVVSNKVVGTAMVSREGKVAYISTVMVHPKCRRQGIARRLIENALEYAKRKKMKRAILHVIPTNSPAKNLYLDLGFKNFERIAYLTMDTKLKLPPENLEGIKISSFRRNQIAAVYDLIRSSEDPRHLEVFDFKKRDLLTSLFDKVFHFSTKLRLVAVQNTRPIGYAEATYTTAQEAGQIANVQVCQEMKGKGIEEILIFEAASEIKKMGTRKVLGIASAGRLELIAAMERLGFEKSLELDGMFLEFS